MSARAMYRNPDERMEEVVGGAARIDALDDSALDERIWSLIDRLQKFHGLPPQREIHHFYGTLARSPGAFAAFLDLGTELSTATALDARSRELVILRVGWLLGGPYVWGEHVKVARREGLSVEEIERVTKGSTSEGWSDRERALLKGVEELHADAMISDATWADLAAHYDERQLVELPMLVGHYHLTVFVQNALRIRLNPHNVGLPSR
jgi:alkylhydroperoxidase family enzyme